MNEKSYMRTADFQFVSGYDLSGNWALWVRRQSSTNLEKNEDMKKNIKALGATCNLFK